MVKEWDSYGGLDENLWGWLKAIKEVIKRWQPYQYVGNKRRIQICEKNLKEVLTNSVPTVQAERELFQENKRKLMPKLNQLKMVEESM